MEREAYEGHGRFDEATVDAVWRKGRSAHALDPERFRLDARGALIAREQYGHTGSALGWVIEHELLPVHGGEDGLENLAPVHWQNAAVRRATAGAFVR